MIRFRSIEGLRGWLAWTVVLSHVAFASGIYIKGLGPFFEQAGGAAVYVFIIISGFVITHLIIEKREPYSVYIFRRFMRIFPLFAVACTIGFFSSTLAAKVPAHVTWGDKTWFHLFVDQFNSQEQYFWSNFWAHLTMFHSAISTTILPNGMYVFNAPAWSLSLEWQFYLVAPLMIFLAKKEKMRVVAVFLVAVLCIFYDFNAFGEYPQRSLLLGSAPLFAIGIASRVAYPQLVGRIPSLSIVIALCVALIPMGWDLSPILVWGCLYAILIADDSNASLMDQTILKYSCLLFESRFSTFFGARSYSIYLCHWPILGVTCYILMRLCPNASTKVVFIVLFFVVTTTTALCSCFLYLTVEKPGIRLGNLVNAGNVRASQKRALLTISEEKLTN